MIEALPGPELLAAGAAVAIVVMFAGLNLLMKRSVDVGHRLSMYASAQVAFETSKGPSGAGRDSTIGSRMDRVLVRRGFAERIARDLMRANLRLTVSEYLMLHPLCAMAGFAAGYLAIKHPFGGLFIGTLALFVPRIVIKVRHRQRLTAFNSQLADTLMLMANSLRSGYSLLQAMEVVAREGPAPTVEEFQRVIREVALGLSPQEALNNLVDRVASEDLEMMVIAINVQHEVGGSLARILDSIGHTIRERVRIQGEIRSLTAQQRLSGYVIAALPVAVGVGLYVMNPEYMGVLFTNKFVICGPAFLMPIVAGIMIVVGFIIIQRIVDIKV